MKHLPIKSIEPKFYEFHQNNSGGSFDIDDNRGIGPYVWIEAVDLDHAVSRASNIGIYFDGVANGQDCPCCGDRWHEPYGEPKTIVALDEEYDFIWHDVVYVHRIDGTIDRLTK